MFSPSVRATHNEANLSFIMNQENLSKQDSFKFVSQAKIDEAMALANGINYKKINAKLENYYGWSKEDITATNTLYKEWLALQICYPDVDLSPNKKLDEYWHMHILDTLAYTQDCLLLFGQYLHHYPYFGLEGDAGALEEAFELTNKIYVHHFGHALKGAANPCGSTSCR